MNVALTGSHGLIGRAVADSLVSDGHRVVRLVRSGPASGLPPATVRWEPMVRHIDRDALETNGPYDAVVHLGGVAIGERRWTTQRRREIVGSRVRSTDLLVEAIVTLDPAPPVLVCASAVGFYGDRGDEVLTEDSGAGAGFLAELCIQWEAAAARVATATATRVVSLRTGVVLSRHGGLLGRLLPVFKIGLGGRIGSGTQYTSWIALDDEVAVVRRAIEDPALSGPVNATSPQPVTNAALTAAIGRALHRPTPLAVPPTLLSLALGRAFTDEMLTISQRVLPLRLEAAGHRFLHVDVDETLRSMLAVTAVTPAPPG